MVPPTSLPYSEGFDSPAKDSPTSSTSSASLGARSAPNPPALNPPWPALQQGFRGAGHAGAPDAMAPLRLHTVGIAVLLQWCPQPCWTALWSASLKDSSAPVLAPPLHLPDPGSSHQQHCVSLLGARWAWLCPCTVQLRASHCRRKACHAGHSAWMLLLCSKLKGLQGTSSNAGPAVHGPETVHAARQHTTLCGWHPGAEAARRLSSLCNRLDQPLLQRACS